MKTTYSSFLLAVMLSASSLAGCSSDSQPQSASPAQQAPVVQAKPEPLPVVSQPIPHSPATVNWVLPSKEMMTRDDQSIVVVPEDMMAVNWAVVLDNSGSMKTTQCSGQETRMVAGGKAVIAFSKKRSGSDNFALILFTGNHPFVRLAMPLGQDRALLMKEVEAARADFNTPLGPAIEAAYGELFKQGKRQGWYGSYHIVVVTDGDWNQGADPGPIVKRIVSGSPVQIHTVGFCTGDGHRLNIPGYTSYVSADNAEQVNKGLQAVLTAESEVFTDSQFSK